MSETTSGSESQNPAPAVGAGSGLSRPAGFREDRTEFQALIPSSPDQEPKAEKWAADNAKAIAANLERIEKYGTFGEDLRSW
jgi:hypothetical protein